MRKIWTSETVRRQGSIEDKIQFWNHEWYIKVWRFCIPMLFLLGCSPISLEDYHYEGENIARGIADELAKVYSEKDLQVLAPKLKKRFLAMVDLMGRVRRYQR